MRKIINLSSLLPLNISNEKIPTPRPIGVANFTKF